MGVFGSKSKKQSKPGGKTIIASGCKLKGEIVELPGDLHIDGIFEGIVESNYDLSIGKTGQIKGLIKAKKIAVSGFLDGRVACEKVDILSTGKLIGSVITHELVIEEGGKFVGESKDINSDPDLVEFSDLVILEEQDLEEVQSEKLEKLKNSEEPIVNLVQKKEELASASDVKKNPPTRRRTRSTRTTRKTKE